MTTTTGLAVMPLIPEQANYSSSYGDDEFLSVKLDGGISRFRRDKFGCAETVEVQWALGPTDFTFFQAFYRSTILAGSASFLMVLILENAAALRHVCHFVGPLKLTQQQGLTYVIKAQLEVVPFFEDTFANGNIVSARIAAEHLRLWLPFTDHSFDDWSINNCTMTPHGANLLLAPVVNVDPGVVRGQVYVNSSDNTSYLQIATHSHSGSIRTASYTKALWFKTSTGSAGAFLDASDATELFELAAGPNILALHSSAGGSVTAPWSGFGVWHHAAVTYDFPTLTIRLYVDGVQGGVSAAYPQRAMTGLLEAFGRSAVSAGLGGAGNTGFAQDLRLYDYALSGQEIHELYQTTLL